jgi:hypothetical protein
MTSWREPYFTDASGREWHVYDTVVRGRTHRAVKYASPRATYRVFVAEDRTRMIYQFGDGEPRELDAAHLERKLKQARTRDAWAQAFRPTRRATSHRGGSA